MWVCAELGVEFEQHNGFAFRNDPWALELNPKGTVPFIKDGDLVLNVSTPIVFALVEQFRVRQCQQPYKSHTWFVRRRRATLSLHTLHKSTAPALLCTPRPPRNSHKRGSGWVGVLLAL